MGRAESQSLEHPDVVKAMLFMSDIRLCPRGLMAKILVSLANNFPLSSIKTIFCWHIILFQPRRAATGVMKAAAATNEKLEMILEIIVRFLLQFF